MPDQLFIERVVVVGPGRPQAEVCFRRGLNDIVGASDTGKSYIFQTIDYLLGGGTVPKPNPYSDGYNRAWLQLATSNGKRFSIERVFGEEFVNVYRTALDLATPASQVSRIHASHQTGSKDSLSHLLLNVIGLADRQVKRDSKNQKNALTLRALVHLTMVDEQRIITDESPALSGQFTLNTVEQGIFSLLLTGNDDSALTPVKGDKKLRDSGLDGQIEILDRLIGAKEKHLAAIVENPLEIETTLARLSETVREGTTVITDSKEKLSAMNTKRQLLWSKGGELRSSMLVLREQLRRLSLLLEYYNSDSKRLEAVIEASEAFVKLPSGECPTCGQNQQTGNQGHMVSSIESFQAACRAELAKIATLAIDLKRTVLEFELELEELTDGERNCSSAIASIDHDIAKYLEPFHNAADLKLNETIRHQAEMQRAKYLKDEIVSLKANVASVQAQKRVTIPRAKNTPRVDTQMAQGFCRVYTETLMAWKYPLRGTVAFDPTTFDLVIGNQHRGAMGKGYRAITHAAFTVSLMRFCREARLPYTGFVVLDSPLNPFRGEVRAPGPDGAVNDDIKAAFYRDLAADKSGDQYIILENTEPPAGLLADMNYVQFTKNASFGRYGFFPVN